MAWRRARPGPSCRITPPALLHCLLRLLPHLPPPLPAAALPPRYPPATVMLPATTTASYAMPGLLLLTTSANDADPVCDRYSACVLYRQNTLPPTDAM